MSENYLNSSFEGYRVEKLHDDPNHPIPIFPLAVASTKKLKQFNKPYRGMIYDLQHTSIKISLPSIHHQSVLIEPKQPFPIFPS